MVSEILPFYSHNGQIRPHEKLKFSSDNRLFKFGDGLFETIRISWGAPLFFKHHYTRLVYGCDALGIELDAQFSPAVFRDQLLKLANANELKSGRARMTVFRKGGIRYAPTDNRAEVIIEMEAIADDLYQWNEIGLNLGLFEELTLQSDSLSFVKSANALPYVLASKWAAEHGYDDAIMLNQNGHVCEATASNVFAFNGECLISPTLSEGPVDGVMRRIIIALATKKGLPFEERPLSLQELIDSKEIFLTNAISGIRWVSDFSGKIYANDVGRGLFIRLDEKLR